MAPGEGRTLQLRGRDRSPIALRGTSAAFEAAVRACDRARCPRGRGLAWPRFANFRACWRRTLGLGVLLWCCAVYTAPAQEIEHATIAPLASRSLLLDAARAGERVVVVGERGHVLLSDDEGRRWRQARVPTLAMLTAVYFVDAGRGWAVGHDEVIVRTADGGEHWERVHYAPENQQPLLDVWFRDADYGLAVGAYGTLLLTTDGGHTWERRALSVQNPGRAGAAVGADAHEEVIEAADEDLAIELEDRALDRHLNQLARAEGGRLYLAAEAGELLVSENGGRSWARLPSPYEGSFFGVLALEGGELLVFGLRGHLFRSTDGGVHWSQIPTGTQAMLTDGLKRRDGSVVISGLAGTLLVSRHGGRQFELRQRLGRRGIQALLELSGDAVLAVGEGGVERLVP